MSSKIAFIVEGFQEFRFLEGFRSMFSDQIEIIPYPVGRNLHAITLLNQLYDEVQSDDDIDFIEHFCSLAKKYCQDPTRMTFVESFDYAKLRSEDFSEVYLLFDLDNHDPQYKDDIKKVLNFFNNETEQGKLYLSYPMIESTVDIGLCHECAQACLIEKCYNVDYKKIVGSRSSLATKDEQYEEKITFQKELIQLNQGRIMKEYFQRIKCLFNGQLSNEDMKALDPINIFIKQLEVHAHDVNKVMSISGLVNLITNYFEYAKIKELIVNEKMIM